MKRIACLVLVLSLFSSTAEAGNEAMCSGATDLVRQLAELGDIKPKEKDWSQVYVSLRWYGYEFEQKKNVATIIAKCLAPSGATYFYDSKSGKEVARLTNFGGFKVN